MYRMLVMLPKSADPAQVDALMEGIASSFGTTGSASITRSVGSLMGPGARDGAAGWILEADFGTLEDALAALGDEDFQDIKAKAEALTSTIFLYEIAQA
jgi:hypothetical protein